MDRLKIFERVRDHLLRQRSHAVRDHECCYLDRHGKRCAIGCLIPDGHPSLHFVGSVDDLIASFPDLKPLWGVESQRDVDFLNQLQAVHDANHPSLWPLHLGRLEAMVRGHRP